MSYSNARYFIYSIYSIYSVCRYETLLSNPFDEDTYGKYHFAGKLGGWNLCWKNDSKEEKREAKIGRTLNANKFSLETSFASLLTVYRRLRFYAPCAHRYCIE